MSTGDYRFAFESRRMLPVPTLARPARCAHCRATVGESRTSKPRAVSAGDADSCLPRPPTNQFGNWGYPDALRVANEYFRRGLDMGAVARANYRPTCAIRTRPCIFRDLTKAIGFSRGSTTTCAARQPFASRFSKNEESRWRPVAPRCCRSRTVSESRRAAGSGPASRDRVSAGSSLGYNAEPLEAASLPPRMPRTASTRVRHLPSAGHSSGSSVAGTRSVSPLAACSPLARRRREVTSRPPKLRHSHDSLSVCLYAYLFSGAVRR